MFVLKKLYVTLVELLIVITILIMMTGIIGVNIRKLMQEQRFDTEVSLVVDELRTAQNLMLILGYDIDVKFEKTPEGIKFWMEVDKLLSGNWNREITRQHPKLTAIKSIEFQEGGSSTHIKFYSKGSAMSQGILILSNSENRNDSKALVSYICLPGFPAKIESVAKEIENRECNPKNEAEYNEKLSVAFQREMAQKQAIP